MNRKSRSRRKLALRSVFKFEVDKVRGPGSSNCLMPLARSFAQGGWIPLEGFEIDDGRHTPATWSILVSELGYITAADKEGLVKVRGRTTQSGQYSVPSHVKGVACQMIINPLTGKGKLTAWRDR